MSTSQNSIDNQQPDTQNKATSKKRSRLQLPGSLVANADVLEFHNKYSKMLIEGRPGDKQQKIRAIIGLIRFASITKQITKAAQADDPYADMILLLLEEKEVKLSQQIEHFNNEVNNAVNKVVPKGFNIDFEGVHSTEPARFEIAWGANPYATRCAFKLKRADEVLCTIWLARHKGLITRNDAMTLTNRLQHRVRSYLSVVQDWKVFGLTRADYIQKNQRAQSAEKHFGFSISDAVLSRELRGEHAPNINPAILQDQSSSFLDD